MVSHMSSGEHSCGWHALAFTMSHTYMVGMVVSVGLAEQTIPLMNCDLTAFRAGQSWSCVACAIQESVLCVAVSMRLCPVRRKSVTSLEISSCSSQLATQMVTIGRPGLVTCTPRVLRVFSHLHTYSSGPPPKKNNEGISELPTCCECDVRDVCGDLLPGVSSTPLPSSPGSCCWVSYGLVRWWLPCIWVL